MTIIGLAGSDPVPQDVCLESLRTLHRRSEMSASPLRADVLNVHINVRFVP